MLPRLRHALISIHSLRMEGDKIRLGLFFQLGHFNPLPPHGGRQEYISGCEVGTVFQSTPSAWRETPSDSTGHGLSSFQSTPSAWRETRADYVSQQRWLDFNPLPPHGGRLYILDECKLTERISIHSLRMEGDAKILFHVKRFLIFQSTPSAWRETFRGADDISGNLFQSTPSAWRETQGKRFCA